ncbi:anti sigma factor C-terminal domain-containing protein, partial [Paenibacillus xylanilyticus]
LEDGIKTNGKYQHEFERIYDYLRRDKEKPDTSDVRILGVVVTGTADSLKALQEQKYVKAAVLGAIVDK